MGKTFSSCIVLAIMLKTVFCLETCSKLEFPEVYGNTFHTRDKSTVSLQFRLNTTNCSQNPHKYFIEVQREINDTLLDVCKIWGKPGEENCILDNQGLFNCSCNMLVFKQVTMGNNGVYVWRWSERRGQFTKELEKKLTLHVHENANDTLKEAGPVVEASSVGASSVGASSVENSSIGASHVENSRAEADVGAGVVTKIGATFEAGVGAGIALGVLLLVLAIIIIIICRRRRSVKNNTTCLHSAPAQGQTSQKYVYSSVLSDVENGGARHDEDSKGTPEMLEQAEDKTECRQVDGQGFHSVIELLKVMGFTNSPGRIDSSGDLASIKTPNVKTKLSYRRGADGSIKCSWENSVCSPDNLSHKEPAIPGQEAGRLKSPLKACALVYRETDLKTSIDVQEQAIQDAHDALRYSKCDNQEPQQTDSRSVDLKGASKFRLEDVSEEHSFTQTSFPREDLQSSHGFANYTHDFTGKPKQMHKSREIEAPKMTHEQCQSSGNTQHQFKEDITHDMPLSQLTEEKKYFENKMEPEEFAEAESGSRVEIVKVRHACV